MSALDQQNLRQLEADLWQAADQLRANSKLDSAAYFMPVLGIIFLRHAANRFETASRQIAEDQANGKMPKRPLKPADYLRRRALYLPEEARFDLIMERASNREKAITELVTEAMEAIEKSFVTPDGLAPLKGVLPKDYGIFDDPKVLEDLMRTFNSEQIKQATGDVFGRIYEYFLAEFSKQRAHDNGEFFTPPSLVQMIVNVIEPEHGIVFDPACGSGGMFVQSSHFIEHTGGDTARKVVFYGQEKNPTTIRIAKMNLAVHGLEGKIAEAITYYKDEHQLVGKCDFVMANPPFNVDLVDAKKAKEDKARVPFGIPGENKQGKVSNANYLWISYFWSYLNEKGRAGFVMSSQASSAGYGERDVRKKIIETADVDVMISIRGNFFYTRTVPCELWFFDKGKPDERRDTVLMVDARSIYRKVSRAIYDFSPEQLANLTAIVWLHRGQTERFAALLDGYREKVREHRRALLAALPSAREAMWDLGSRIKGCNIPHSAEFQNAMQALDNDIPAIEQMSLSRGFTNDAAALPDFAAACRTLLGRLRELRRVAEPLIAAGLVEVDAEKENKKHLKTQRQRADEAWARAGAEAEAVVYFTRLLEWLSHRFPEGRYRDVAGLCKAVTRAEIAAADWSLTPGRYVGVAPAEEDEDFDFEQTMRDIHAELKELNAEAAELAGKIEANFENLLG